MSYHSHRVQKYSHMLVVRGGLCCLGSVICVPACSTLWIAHICPLHLSVLQGLGLLLINLYVVYSVLISKQSLLEIK
uniref:Uncharacterized protein n=1 Tax=Anguilla anguilla TaxID=7936 RepID=A0A0E9WT47_ANGAN